MIFVTVAAFVFFEKGGFLFSVYVHINSFFYRSSDLGTALFRYCLLSCAQTLFLFDF